MTAADELARVLEDEFAALLGEDTSALALAVSRKQSLLAASPRFSAADARRLAFLNERNARALAPRRQIADARLQVLRSAAGQPAALYAASGTVSSF